jgi:diguanylate cyclase (GGDEF)-like protein
MPVATRLFTLVEGKLAYLLHRPINEGGSDSYSGDDGMANRYVILVILAKSLIGNMPEEMPGYGVKLYYSDSGPNNKKGFLYNKQEAVQSRLESFLFPELSVNLPLNSKTQPFVLVVKKQLGWSIFNVWLLCAFAILAGISLYLLVKYLTFYRMAEINRAQEADQLFYLANHDSLTGLANRSLMLDRLQHALIQAKRRNTKLAVLFMDLDEFKNINDEYGHGVGDKLLTSVSERLLACIRSGDTLARRSGDEFVLILENIDDVENVHKVIGTIHQAFEQKFSFGEIELTITVAVGYSVYPDDATSADNLLNLADKRMYENKRHS